MPRRLSVAAAIAAIAALAACGGGSPPARQCPDDAPVACASSPAPRFSVDAAPLIASHCAKCHAPGGLAEKVPFQTYAQIAPVAGDMKLELETCEMPPAPEAPLSPTERQTLFAWITCGALND